MSLTHLNYPLNSEFGEISSLEESHEDATENGYGVPGICSHNQSDFLNKRIPPFKYSKEELVAFF